MRPLSEEQAGGGLRPAATTSDQEGRKCSAQWHSRISAGALTACKPSAGVAGRKEVGANRSAHRATFVLATVLCSQAASAFVVTRANRNVGYRCSPLGRTCPFLCGLRGASNGASDAKGGGGEAGGEQAGKRDKLLKATDFIHRLQPSDTPDGAAQKQVGSTQLVRMLSKQPQPQPLEGKREAVDDAGFAFVGVWASWLNENCPSNLTSTLAGLTDERASQRKAAVARLLKQADVKAVDGSVGRDSASWAFAALAARLGDDSAAVREAAVKGLATISEKGNRNLVLAMANLIEEETAITVRTAALQALTRVAHRGDNEALEPVLNLLRRVEGTERGEYFNPNLSTGIKAQAVKALSTLAAHDNDSAIKIMSGRILDDPNPQVREAAIKGMASLAMNYDRSPHVPQMTWALAIACHDGDERVRTAALKHLRLLQKRHEAKQVLAGAVGQAPLHQRALAGRLPPMVIGGLGGAGGTLDDEEDARMYWLLPDIWEP